MVLECYSHRVFSSKMCAMTYNEHDCLFCITIKHFGYIEGLVVFFFFFFGSFPCKFSHFLPGLFKAYTCRLCNLFFMCLCSDNDQAGTTPVLYLGGPRSVLRFLWLPPFPQCNLN